jgi:homoserine O-acetyltransferase
MPFLIPLLLLQAAVAQTPPLTPAVTTAAPASRWPARDAQFTIRQFLFRSGETLPELRVNYTMLGQPHRNAQGEIDNAVMVLHGTGGTGRQFLGPQFADELYGRPAAGHHALLDHSPRRDRTR